MEVKLEKSDVPILNTANKQVVISALSSLKSKIEPEDEQRIQEVEEWTQNISEAISGEKCIICLQPFNFEKNEKIDVLLCPECKYAGHPEHFKTWLNERSSCPMCRTDLEKEKIIEGFLVSEGDELIFSNIK